MKNSDTLHPHENGIVDEILHSIDCFISAHSTHVDVLMEVLPAAVYCLARHPADRNRIE